MPAFRFDAGGVSDIGNGKPTNEDSILVLCQKDVPEKGVLVAVADGVSSLGKGAMASKRVTDRVRAWWQEADWGRLPGQEEIFKSLATMLRDTNKALVEEARRDNIRMGTTLSLLLLLEDRFGLYHIGDSRIYRVDRFGQIEALTVDHTKKLPKEIDGQVFEKAYLTECLGFRNGFNWQQATGRLNTGDLFLVCSDGIYKTIGDREIGKIVRRHRFHTEKACQRLVELAKRNGELDNLSAAVVRTYK